MNWCNELFGNHFVLRFFKKDFLKPYSGGAPAIFAIAAIFLSGSEAPAG
jgi:hypothetical protein